MTNKNDLTENDISDILLLNARNTEAMKGKIRAKGKCPVCSGKFEHIVGTAMRCPIHKTSPERLFIDIFYDGKRLKLYTDRHGQILDSYSRALHLLTHINAEIKDHTFDPTHYVKSEQQKFYTSILLDTFLETKLNGSDPIAPSYVRHYRRYVGIAKEHFGNTDVRDLKKRNIILYHDHIVKTQTFGNKTRKNTLDVFKTFMRYIQDMEIITNIPPFPVINFAEPVITTITPETQELLWENIEDQHKPIFSLMFLAGIRPSETRALRCKSVDIKANLITIIDNFSQGVLRNTRKGIGSKPAIIPIHCEMLPYLKDRVENNLPGAFVFVNEKGEYYKESTLRKIWYRARDKTGIDKNCTLYSASRHTFISDLLENDVSLYDASQLAGHSNIKTTLRYAHSNKKKLKAKVETRSLIGRKIIKLKKVK